MTVFAVVQLSYRIAIVVEIFVGQFSVAVLEQEVSARHRALNDRRYRVGFFFCVQFASPALHETESEKQSDVRATVFLQRICGEFTAVMPTRVIVFQGTAPAPGWCSPRLQNVQDLALRQ